MWVLACAREWVTSHAHTGGMYSGMLWQACLDAGQLDKAHGLIERKLHKDPVRVHLCVCVCVHAYVRANAHVHMYVHACECVMHAGKSKFRVQHPPTALLHSHGALLLTG